MKKSKRGFILLMVTLYMLSILGGQALYAAQPENVYPDIETAAEAVRENGAESGEEDTSIAALVDRYVQDEMARQSEACAVERVEMNGNLADVYYHTDRPAQLMVAIFDENDLQLITSAHQEVSSGDYQMVSLIIDAEKMPQYYQIRAFLLDPETFVAISAPYTSNEYTSAIQQGFAMTQQDFDDMEGRIIASNEEAENFAVLNDTTYVADETSNFDQITMPENGIYIVSNPSEKMLQMKAGDSLLFYDGFEGRGIKAKTVTLNTDGTITIERDYAAGIGDFFEYVKIDSANDQAEFLYDDSEKSEEVCLIQTTGLEGMTPVSYEEEDSFGEKSILLAADKKKDDKKWKTDDNTGFAFDSDLKVEEDNEGFINVSQSFTVKATLGGDATLDVDKLFMDAEKYKKLHAHDKDEYAEDGTLVDGTYEQPDPVNTLKFKGGISGAASLKIDFAFKFMISKKDQFCSLIKEDTLSVVFAAEGKLTKTIDLGKASVVFHIGIVPFTLSFKPTFEISAEGKVSLTMSYKVKKGFSYEKNENSEPVKSDLSTKPEVDVSFNRLKVTIEFNLSVEVKLSAFLTQELEEAIKEAKRKEGSKEEYEEASIASVSIEVALTVTITAKDSAEYVIKEGSGTFQQEEIHDCIQDDNGALLVNPLQYACYDLTLSFEGTITGKIALFTGLFNGLDGLAHSLSFSVKPFELKGYWSLTYDEFGFYKITGLEECPHKRYLIKGTAIKKEDKSPVSNATIEFEDIDPVVDSSLTGNARKEAERIAAAQKKTHIPVTETLTTDGEGKFQIYLQPYEYKIKASTDELEGETPLTVSKAASVTVEMDKKEYDITLHAVKKKDGSAVADVPVGGVKLKEPVSTDNTGKAEFKLKNGTYTVTLRKTVDGEELKGEKSFTVDHAPVSLTVEMEGVKKRKVDLTVQTDDGTPVKSAMVSDATLNEGKGGFAGLTDESGKLMYEAEVGSDTISASATVDGQSLTGSTTVEIVEAPEGSDAPQPVTVTLKQGYEITFHAVNDKGEVQSGAKIVVPTVDEPLYTDGSGNASCRLKSGTYTAAASKDDLAGNKSFMVTKNDTVEITLKKPLTLNVNVVNSADEPVDGASVSAKVTGSAGTAAVTSSALSSAVTSGGSAQLKLAEGSYKVSASHEGKSNSTSVALSTDGQSVTIKLSKLYDLTLSVTGSYNEAVSGAVISFSGPKNASATTGSDGSAHLTDMPEGDYNVVITYKGNDFDQGTVNIPNDIGEFDGWEATESASNYGEAAPGEDDDLLQEDGSAVSGAAAAAEEAAAFMDVTDISADEAEDEDDNENGNVTGYMSFIITTETEEAQSEADDFFEESFEAVTEADPAEEWPDETLVAEDGWFDETELSDSNEAEIVLNDDADSDGLIGDDPMADPEEYPVEDETWFDPAGDWIDLQGEPDDAAVDEDLFTADESLFAGNDVFEEIAAEPAGGETLAMDAYSYPETVANTGSEIITVSEENFYGADETEEALEGTVHDAEGQPSGESITETADADELIVVSMSRTQMEEPDEESVTMVRMMTASGLMPNQYYTALSVIDEDADDVLSDSNLVYIGVHQSDADGNLSLRYAAEDAYTGLQVWLLGSRRFELEEAQVSAEASEYTGQSVVPAVKAVLGDYILVDGQDYTITYSETAMDPGIYEGTITGLGYFTGEKNFTYQIKEKPADPVTPETPQTPDQPKIPDQPQTPDQPKTPSTPSTETAKTQAPAGNTVTQPPVDKETEKADTPTNEKTETQPSVTVGAVLTDAGGKHQYTVTALGEAPTVAYAGNLTGAKSVTIPTSVTISGINFKVTSIAKKAFYKNKKLKKVVIGKNIARIGAKAFFGCSKLKTITIKTSKLTGKTVGSKAFKGTAAKAKVKVPKKKLKAYKKFLRKKGISKKATIQK